MNTPHRPAAAPRSCPRCGAALAADARFCAACGQPLAPPWRLRAISPAGQGQHVTLGDAPLLIGRAPGSTLRLDDPRISRSHARIAWDGQGFMLSDLGSSGGTFLNQARLAAPAYLRPGDQIGLGGAVELRVESEPPPAGLTPAQIAPTMLATPVAAPAPAPPQAVQPRRQAGRLRGCGCLGSLLLLAALGALAALALGGPPGWPPQIGAIFQPTSQALPVDAAIPAPPDLPGADVEGPAITATLDGLAAALRAGDADAAAAHFAPEVREEYRALFGAHADRLDALAGPLAAAQLDTLSPFAELSDGRRSAEVAVQADGVTFYIDLVKIDGQWMLWTF